MPATHPTIPSFQNVDTRMSLLAAALLCLGAASGCGGKERLEVAPVGGQVLYGDRGVAGATVIFHPLSNISEEAKQMRPYAFADADGRFQLKTYVDGDGVPPGDYRVSIAFASAGAASGRDDGAPANPAVGAKPAVSIPLEVRKKYSNVETAGLAVTILDGQNELEPFNLQ